MLRLQPALLVAQLPEDLRPGAPALVCASLGRIGD
jgi:hypothetical protein